MKRKRAQTVTLVPLPDRSADAMEQVLALLEALSPAEVLDATRRADIGLTTRIIVMR